MGGVSLSARGACGLRHGDARACACRRADRGRLSGHLIEEIIARAARIKQRLSSVILANLVLGENVVPELLQLIAPRNALPRRSCR